MLQTNTNQQVVRYCAWCEKPKVRLPYVFYSSSICPKHLLELRQGTNWKTKKNKESSNAKVVSFDFDEKIATRMNFNSVTFLKNILP